MLVFKAVIDEFTCDVCKERDGKQAFYNWSAKILTSENGFSCDFCRCILVEDDKQDVEV